MSPGTFCRSVTNEDATTEGFGFTAPASIARKDTATRNSKFLFRMQSHKEFDDHLLQVRRPEFASPSQRGPDQRPDLRPDQRSSKSLVTTSVALVPSSFLLLVVRHLLLVAMPGAPSSVLAPRIYIYIYIYMHPCLLVPCLLGIPSIQRWACCLRLSTALDTASHSVARTSVHPPQLQGHRVEESSLVHMAWELSRGKLKQCEDDLMDDNDMIHMMMA